MDRRAFNPLRWKDFNAYPRPGLITLMWRWRSEIAIIVALLVFEYVLAKVMGLIGGVLVILATAGVLWVVPATRRWMLRRCWCLFTRHQLYAVFRETGTTTRMGRLPLIMRVSPTDQGERVAVWCRAGIPVEQLQEIESEIRDACMANEVYFPPVHAPLARIEIVRKTSKSHGPFTTASLK
jgi:hypothetical protein